MELISKRLRLSSQADSVLVVLLLLLDLVGPASTGMAQTPGRFAATGNMTTARAGHTATLLLNGKVLITGGWNPSVSGRYDPAIASAELYDPSTGTFVPAGNMTTARMAHTATLLADGRVLISGGYADSSPTSSLHSAELYDPSTGTFDATGEMFAGGPTPAVLLTNGKVLITGGPSAELYDPATGAFVITGAYAGTSRGRVHTATLLPDGRVLIAGWAAFCEDPQLYDPRTDTFSVTGPMTECDRVYKAVTMPNGKVLFAGNIESNYIAAAEVYDPATGTFTDLKMTIPRNSSTVTPLPDGTVLITGAQLPGGHGDSRAELYDPATGTFGTAGNMTTGRHSHTATLLPDGTVLVAGGFSAWLQPAISSAEVYRPSVPLPPPVLSSILHAGTPQLTSSSSPASAGEVLQIYCTGLIDGTAIPPQVTIGGRMAEVLYFGKVPGFADLMQVKIRVPSGVTPGPALPVRLIYLGRPSDEVTIAVMAQAPGSFTPTGSMRTGRWAHTATLLADGKVLIAGGQGPGPSTYYGSTELYDPGTGSFTPTGSMAWARVWHTATLLLDGKVLVTGGRGYGGRGFWKDLLASAELYDPVTGTFAPTGDMVEARMAHTATLLSDGKVLIAGGAGVTAELYDPSTGTFTLTGNMSTDWFNPTASLLPDGRVLVVGEPPYGSFTTPELYDPVSGTFSPTGEMTILSWSHTATLLTNGKVLVAGGCVGDGYKYDRAELYDPASGKFSAIGNMTWARCGHTATLLPDGTVLMAGAGGEGYGWSHPASAELYDPATGTFSPAPDMTRPRGVHTATLLNNGQVLIAGGGEFSASAELYHPLASNIAGNPALGTSLLIPSAVYSDEFESSLVVLNMDNEPNNVTITASNHLGDSIGSLTVALAIGGRFRSANILKQLGAAPGPSGPILVHSNNNRLLSAVSEVSSSRGAAGVFPAVNVETAWTQGFILEAIDDGSRGMPGTYRTNLGLINTSGTSSTNVTMTLFNSSGQQVGNPLSLPIAIDCYTGCPEQINTIVQRLRGSTGVTEGYVRISSLQPIIAWASKVENGNDDPSFQIGVGAPSSAQQEARYDVGTRLLVPSSAYSDTFTSSLVVLNMDSQPNSITITAHDTGGNPLAPPFTTTLPAGGQFRTSNILQQLGVASGSFGPISVESTNNHLLSAISEVKSNQGFGGFFPAVNLEAAWTEGFILEVVDSGARGTPTTYRTNLGLNAVSSGTTHVTITLFNDSGQQVGNSISTTVVANGLTQLDNIVQRLRGSTDVSGGYLRIVSSQPIIAWASKVENGTDDPSFQIGIGGASSTATPSQVDSAVSIAEK